MSNKVLPLGPCGAMGELVGQLLGRGQITGGMALEGTLGLSPFLSFCCHEVSRHLSMTSCTITARSNTKPPWTGPSEVCHRKPVP